MNKKIRRKIGQFLINKFLCGTHFFAAKRQIASFMGIKIGKNSKIVGPIYITSKLIIGDNCWIGKELSCEGNGEVIIGDNCDIAPKVTFLTGGHKIGNENRRAGLGEKYKIIIGNGCWIGARATLLNNIIIDNSCVISCCACVTKSFKSNLLIGGVPAKIIKDLNNENNKENKK